MVWAADPDLVIKDLPCIGFTGDRYYRPFKVEGDHIEPEKTILSFDPSGRGRDESSICVASTLNGYIFIRQVEGWSSGYDEQTLKRIARIAKKWKINELIIESNFGDGAVTELLRPILREYHPCVVTETRSSSQKELRIIDQCLEPIMSTHRLIVDRKVIEEDYNSAQGSDRGDRAVQYSLAYQLSRITRTRGCLAQDDRIDALAMACAHFKDMLAKDAKSQMDLRHEEIHDKAIEDFISAADGRAPLRDNWMSSTRLKKTSPLSPSRFT